jgi:hypothetical protein
VEADEAAERAKGQGPNGSQPVGKSDGGSENSYNGGETLADSVNSNAGSGSKVGPQGSHSNSSEVGSNYTA